MFVLFLSIAFVMLFGLPSLQKFFANNTIIIETTKEYGEEDQPAITFCSFQNAFGWKETGNLSQSNTVFQTICNSSSNAEEAYECINKSTFSLSESLLNTVDSNFNVLNESHWSKDITFFFAGKCQTLNSSEVILQTFYDHPFILDFEPNVVRYVWIHDPNFFNLGPNPEMFPRVLIMIERHYGRQTKYLKVILWVKMNLPHKPCEDSPSYSLTHCIRESVSKKVGCRPVWDRWSEKKRKICTEIGELKQILIFI